MEGRRGEAVPAGVRFAGFEPEQTTAALFVAHPDARYFAMATTGGTGGGAEGH